MPLSRSDELLPLSSRAAGLASRADAIADRAHEAARQDAVRSARGDISADPRLAGWSLAQLKELANRPGEKDRQMKLNAKQEIARRSRD
jgi:hypothetical protein